MSVRDCVGGTRLNAIPAENAAIVIYVIDLGIALAAAKAFLLSVLGTFYVDTIGRTSSCAQEAGYAFLEPVLVALQDVRTAKPLLQNRRAVGVLFGYRGLEHLFEGDAHTFGDRRR